MNVLGKYRLETLQIYFPCCMELQEELNRHNYLVPRKTPIPIIYGNYKGYMPGKAPPGPGKEAIIHPSRYGKSLSEMGWKEFSDHFEIPSEKDAFLEILVAEDESFLHLDIEFGERKPNYHLEKVSYRGVPPRIWSNWVMLYLALEDWEDLLNQLFELLKPPLPNCYESAYIKREVQQGGKENTYYVCEDKKHFDKGLGLDVRAYSFCLGCFDHVLNYFQSESEKHGGSSIENLSLRVSSNDIPASLKLGPAKLEGKNPQLMMKLVSRPDYTKTIITTDDKRIEGKARGHLSLCDHEENIQRITVNTSRFFRAVCCAYHFFRDQDPFCDKIDDECYISYLRELPGWFP